MRGLFAGGSAYRAVALRELRRMVRSKDVLLGMSVYPLGLLALAVSVFVSRCDDVHSVADLVFANSGSHLLVALGFMLAAVCGIGFSWLAAYSLVMDTRAGAIDLDLASTVAPGDVIGGKAAAATVLTLAFFALSMPFVALAYALHGIDFFVVAWTLYLVFVAGTVMQSAMLAVAAARRLPAFLRIGLVIALNLGAGAFIAAKCRAPWSGVGMMVERVCRCAGEVPGAVAALVFFGYVGVVAISATALLRALAASLLTPPRLDHAFPLRRAELAVTVGYVGAYALIMAYLQTWGGAGGTVSVEDACLPVFLAIAVAWRAAFMDPAVPRRVALSMPRSLLGRLLKFPLSTGPVQGMAFALGLAGFTMAMTRLMGCAFGWNADCARFLKEHFSLFCELSTPPFLVALALNKLGFSWHRKWWPFIVALWQAPHWLFARIDSAANLSRRFYGASYSIVSTLFGDVEWHFTAAKWTLAALMAVLVPAYALTFRSMCRLSFVSMCRKVRRERERRVAAGGGGPGPQEGGSL